MDNPLKQLMSPNGKPKYLFFGRKGGVGKTSISTAAAVWFTEYGYSTTIVSLAAQFVPPAAQRACSCSAK
jgi:hypothetical protein